MYFGDDIMGFDRPFIDLSNAPLTIAIWQICWEIYVLLLCSVPGDGVWADAIWRRATGIFESTALHSQKKHQFHTLQPCKTTWEESHKKISCIILSISAFCLVSFTKYKKMTKSKFKRNINFNFKLNINLQLTLQISYFSLEIYEITFSYMSLEWSNSSRFKNYELLKIWDKEYRKTDAIWRPSVPLNGLKCTPYWFTLTVSKSPCLPLLGFPMLKYIWHFSFPWR